MTIMEVYDMWTVHQGSKTFNVSLAEEGGGGQI